MTRINLGIHPAKLTDEHLIAEHREIKRICPIFSKRFERNNFSNVPDKFSFGTGHVLFFIDKGLFLYDRYRMINTECNKRGFKVTSYVNNFINTYEGKKEYWNNYIPKQKEIELVKERISDRIEGSNKHYFHYYRKSITKETAYALLDAFPWLDK